MGNSMFVLTLTVKVMLIFWIKKDIPVATYSASNGYLILESQNPYLQTVAKRTYYHYNYTAAFIELDNRNLVMCDGNTFLENVIRQRYTNK